MTHDRRRIYLLHNTIHMTGGEHCVKFKMPSSNGLGFMVFKRFGGKESLTQSISEIMTEVFVEQPWLHRVC